MIKYFPAPDIEMRVKMIIELLRFNHVKHENIYCIRSRGSRSSSTIARIHGLGRIWQKALEKEPTYIIEVISERFDMITNSEQEKTLIHEILHIPQSFRGGFRHHKEHVTEENVNIWYRRLISIRKERKV